MGLIVVIALVALGYWQIPQIGQQVTPQNPWTPTQPTPVPASTYSGILYLEVVDAVLGTGITTSTTTVDVVAADASGNFDFINVVSSDTKAQSANPQAMSTIWREGQEVIIMLDCTGNPTNGLDYYPAMYYVKLGDGATIYELTSASCFQQSGAGYRINPSAGTPLNVLVSKYQASNVYYWNLGKLSLYPRQAAADFDIYLTYNGVTLASVTDASTWVDTAAEITANATLASDIESLTFQMVGANNNVGWGKRFFVVDSVGKIQEYGSVIVVTTACTAAGVPAGWNSLSMPTMYAEKGFYKTISEQSGMMPSKGAKASWTVSIPIDATAAANGVASVWKVWVEDCQNIGLVGTVGTTTAVPSAYGFVTSYGVGAVVPNTALTISSGAGATNQLMSYLTTAS